MISLVVFRLENPLEPEGLDFVLHIMYIGMEIFLMGGVVRWQVMPSTRVAFRDNPLSPSWFLHHVMGSRG
jgi:hypothetical protein